MSRSVVAFAVAIVAFAATTVSAQDGRRCKDISDDAVICTETIGGVETPIAPTLYKFGEGVVHAPGSELAFLIVSNFESTPLTVTVRFLVQGSTQIVTRTVTAAPRTREPYLIHDDLSFVGLKTFSTRVYAPGDIDVSLVLRPASEPFARTILPPLDVVRP